MLEGDWTLEPYAWRWNHVVRLIEPETRHAVELYWAEPTWAFQGWYVNLQAHCVFRAPGVPLGEVGVRPDRSGVSRPPLGSGLRRMIDATGSPSSGRDLVAPGRPRHARARIRTRETVASII